MKLGARQLIGVTLEPVGKLRGRVVVPAGSPEDFVVDLALADEKVRAAMAGKQIVKKIFVPDKLLNIVVK